MADKELTVFVVETGPTIDGGDYHYVFDTLAGKLLKGLKTDYVSVVVFNSSVTDHALEHTGKFRGINVLADFETPSYSQLQAIRAHLDDPGEPDPEASDAFQSLIFSISLFEKTKKKVFTRNIVVVTSSELPLTSYTPEKAGAIPGLLKDLDINLIVIGTDFGAQSDTEQSWFHIASQFSTNHIFNSAEAKKITQLCPPVRKTRPMPAYRGEFRLGADISKVIHDSSCVAEQDNLCLTFRVEVYPAAKAEVLSLGAHEYLVDSDKVVRVERKTEHFIWQKNFQGERDEHLEKDEVDDKKFDKVGVDGKTFTPGFKFSNFDLIALDDDLMAAAKLNLSSEFDIIGFVKAESVPYAYFTDESFFVVPEKSASLKNLLSYAAFAEALYEKGIAPIARFVRKQAKEVEIGPMFPVKVKNGEEFTYCYIMIRFPFKEDEKIGHFPKLGLGSVVKKDPEDSNKEVDETEINKLMENFIESKTFVGEDELDETKDYKTIIDNYKVTLKGSNSSKLPLPPKVESTNKVLCSSPGVNKFSVYLRKLLIKSLLVQEFEAFANNPNFIQQNIREGDDSFTNLFNLENCLSVNSTSPSQKWLSELASKSGNSSKRLLKELGIEYIRKADLKKKKSKKDPSILQAKGDYGADEGKYDAVPDFDF